MAESSSLRIPTCHREYNNAQGARASNNNKKKKRVSSYGKKKLSREKLVISRESEFYPTLKKMMKKVYITVKGEKLVSYLRSLMERMRAGSSSLK